MSHKKAKRPQKKSKTKAQHQNPDQPPQQAAVRLQNENKEVPYSEQPTDYMSHSPKWVRAIYRPIQWFQKLEPTNKFTFVIACFTAVTTLTYVFQAWAFVQSEKPILGITDVRLNAPLTPDAAPRLVIEIKNKGKTTAFVREFKLHVDGGPTVPENAEFRKPYDDITTTILPDDADHVETDSPDKFPSDLIEQINLGRYHIWIVGVVSYADRFGWFGGGETGFCFYYDPTRGRGVDSFYRCHDKRYEYER